MTPKWWITAWVKSPASRNATVFEVSAFGARRPSMRIERDPGKPWRLVHVTRGVASSTVPIWRAFVEGLSAAERARVAIAADVADREAHAAVLS